MPTFATSLATLADLPSIATVSRAAFKDSPNTMSHWMFPQDNEEGIYKWRLQGIVNRFKHDPTTYLVKCFDTSNDQIVSFALWQNPFPREAQEERERKTNEKKGEDEKLPEGTNKLLMDNFDTATQEMRRKYVNTEKDYILRAIATLPEYQGMGCASRLLASGLETVDELKARAFLEATPQGRPVYEKFGWRVVDEMIFDLSKYGCAHVQKITCMMREARE